MTPEEYTAAQAALSAAVAQYVLRLGRLFLAPRLSLTDWIGFLEVLFPEIYQRRLEAAEIARSFYDSERQRHGRPPHPRYLVEYDFPEFVADMEPTRDKMSRNDAPEAALGEVALRAVRNVEMAGRKQILRAVENDPQPELVRGWARVATGRETCAWCLMLISRGPVYLSARSAGFDVDNEQATEIFAAGEDVSEYMREWHTGCDCKVVPVYDRKNWPGYDEWKRAERLWIDAGREASRLIESGEARTRNMNKETQNALRRRLERGDITMTEFAVAA
ncbi:capsid maturation protease [Mycobacterium phage Chupacabra]|uniref:Capsid maturation protease n=3 Tax=Fromanvirus goose TaxID=1211282 RepID=A0A291AUW9_9CAUD|nr:head maturation protease [Mycobacterium phage Goose]AFU20640.1 capsid maturation protease [Mycobacterium phage Goose]ATE84756.1 capsid maturation protease [Mycobacterium phage OKCentral2016]QHB41196.1 capsid maturation protease [Mycobacterium phage Chupacabra]